MLPKPPHHSEPGIHSEPALLSEPAIHSNQQFIWGESDHGYLE